MRLRTLRRALESSVVSDPFVLRHLELEAADGGRELFMECRAVGFTTCRGVLLFPFTFVALKVV